MKSPEREAEGRPPAAGVWDRGAAGWHVAFYGMVILIAVSTLSDSSAPVRNRWAQVALMGLVAVAYSVLGMRGVMQDPTWRSYLYLAIMLAVTVASIALGAMGYVLLFLAYSQIWLLVGSFRTGLWWVLGFTALLITVGWMAAPAEFRLTFAVQYLVASGFAVLLGWWIYQIIEQSIERGDLLAALARAQEELAAANHEAGVVAERERIAREIHDTLAQGFTSIVMLSQAAQAELAAGAPDRAAKRVAQVEETARDNLAEARALVRAFSPVALNTGSLDDALVRLTTSFEAETGVAVTRRLDPVAISRATEIVLLRAAQEAFANIRKHAAAAKVELTLEASAGSATLTVADDGQGIDPAVRPGFGLQNMRDRAAEVGGTVTIGPGETGGTKLVVRIPEEAPA